MLETLKRSIHYDLIYSDRHKIALEGLRVTLIMTALAFLVATVLGMLLCAGRSAGPRGPRRACNVLVSLLNKVPPLVLLMLFANVVFAARVRLTINVSLDEKSGEVNAIFEDTLPACNPLESPDMDEISRKLIASCVQKSRYERLDGVNRLTLKG